MSGCVGGVGASPCSSTGAILVLYILLVIILAGLGRGFC
ncbi:sporulation protein YjcZ [Paenibacillus sp. IHBB 10380]|nr:sporulation protein YjcZ [Paenibacillus sp. IHBB 10380]